ATTRPSPRISSTPRMPARATRRGCAACSRAIVASPAPPTGWGGPRTRCLRIRRCASNGRRSWPRAASAPGRWPRWTRRARRGRGADRALWLATLLSTLSGPEHADELLARLQPLLQEPGAERDARLAWYRSWALQEAGRLAEAESVLAAATDDVQPDVQRAHA